VARASNKIPAGICGILLGGLGIHKFILGYSSAGGIMLGVTLGSFVEAGEDGEGEGLIGYIADPDADNPQETFQTRELRSILKDAVDLLPKKERFVVQLYYFDELTMKEIGTLLNITESRVSQLHTKSMLRLRGKLIERKIEG